MRNKTSILIAVIGVLAFGTLAQAQVATYGGFESWDSLTGTGVAPAGKPTGWSVSNATTGVTRVAGLTADSTYAAMIMTGTTAGLSSGNMAATASGTSFQLSFNVAFSSVTYSGPATGGAGSRVAQMNITQGTSNATLLNLALFSTGSTVGAYSNTAGLFMYNLADTKWHQIGSVNLNSSGVYDTATNTFSNLNVYEINLTVYSFSNSGLSYDISYGLEGGPVLGSELGATYKGANGNDVNGVSALTFVGGWYASTTATPYVIDNVTYGAIPEPTTVALMAGGLLVLCGRQMRRKY